MASKCGLTVVPISLASDSKLTSWLRKQAPCEYLFSRSLRANSLWSQNCDFCSLYSCTSPSWLIRSLRYPTASILCLLYNFSEGITISFLTCQSCWPRPWACWGEGLCSISLNSCHLSRAQMSTKWWTMEKRLFWDQYLLSTTVKIIEVLCANLDTIWKKFTIYSKIKEVAYGEISGKTWNRSQNLESCETALLPLAMDLAMTSRTICSNSIWIVSVMPGIFMTWKLFKKSFII